MLSQSTDQSMKTLMFLRILHFNGRKHLRQSTQSFFVYMYIHKLMLILFGFTVYVITLIISIFTIFKFVHLDFCFKLLELYRIVSMNKFLRYLICVCYFHLFHRLKFFHYLYLHLYYKEVCHSKESETNINIYQQYIKR